VGGTKSKNFFARFAREIILSPHFLNRGAALANPNKHLRRHELAYATEEWLREQSEHFYYTGLENLRGRLYTVH
jgi:hypothetical protein